MICMINDWIVYITYARSLYIIEYQPTECAVCIYFPGNRPVFLNIFLCCLHKDFKNGDFMEIYTLFECQS